MSSGNWQPFIDSRAFDKVNSTYVTFPSQSDAMLASLQMFHEVPCRFMDLVFSVITHPEFDSKQVTLYGSTDVIDIVEERRLKDRMAVVQERSASRDGRVMQAGFPQFILDEVLDIIHAERMNLIKALFEETLDEEAMYCKSMEIEEDYTLKAMTVVHRSWNSLAHKALGRVLHIDRPTIVINFLLSSVRQSIFGPWTSAVAVQLFHPVEYHSYSYTYECAEVIDREECRQWFEILHHILVGFTNLKCLYIKSYAPLFTGWSNLTFDEMVWRNVRLEEVTLYTEGDKAFHLDSLIQNATVVKNLRTLNIQGAWIFYEVEEDAMREPGFACLSNVTIKCVFELLENDLRLISILSSQSKSCLESLRTIDADGRRESFEDDVARTFTPSQCAAVFGHLRSLHIDSKESVDQWLKWIGPSCSGLQSLILDINVSLAPDSLNLIPITIRSLDVSLWTVSNTTFEEITGWMKCLLKITSSMHFPKLISFTLFISKGYILAVKRYESRWELARNLRKFRTTEMQHFEAEMSAVCEGVKVKCCLNF